MMKRFNSSRPLTCLAVCFFLVDTASSAMVPFIVIWAHRNTGLEGAAAGVVFIGQALGEFAGGLAGGGLADRLGHRRVLVISTVGMTVSYGALAWASVPALAILLFGVAGVFESAFHPTALALVGDVTDEDKLLRAFSMIRIGANAGRIVGPLVGALVALCSLSAVFLVSGALLGLCIPLQVTFLPRDAVRARDDDLAEDYPQGVVGVLGRDRGLALLVFGSALMAIAFSWWQADGLALLRSQTEVSTTTYAALFTVAAATVVIGQVPTTRAIAHLPASWALLIGALLQGVGLAVLIVAHAGYVILIVAVMFMAVGEMVYGPTVSAMAAKRARPGQRASYQAALSITEDIGTAAGPISGLALARVTVSGGVWVTGAMLSVAAGVVSWLAARETRNAPTWAPLGPR